MTRHGRFGRGLWPILSWLRSLLARSSSAASYAGEWRRHERACAVASFAGAAPPDDAGGRRWLLVTKDSYWGAVGLFALMNAGAEVIMPQNSQPGTLAAISDAWDVLVC